MENVRAYLGALHNLGVVEDPMKAFAVSDNGDNVHVRNIPWASWQIGYLLDSLSKELGVDKLLHQSSVRELKGSLASASNVEFLAKVVTSQIYLARLIIDGLRADLPKIDSL